MFSPVRPARWATLLALPLAACSIEVGGSNPFPQDEPDAAPIDDAGVEPMDDGAAPPMEASVDERDADEALPDVDLGLFKDVRLPPVDGDVLDADEADAHADARADADAQPGDADAGPAPCVQKLKLSVRDFQQGHPDFPKVTISTSGLLEEQLDAEHKPVRAARSLLTGPHAFEQWFHDVAGINQRIEVEYALGTVEPGRTLFERSPFYPIDGQGFGNGPSRLGFLPGIVAQGTGAAHNYLFTTEGHLRFTYRGGETLGFTSNDDVWIFVNDRLALDLGATYRVEGASVALDTLAAQLGLEKGKVYRLDIFHAARSLADGRYRLDTTIDLACID